MGKRKTQDATHWYVEACFCELAARQFKDADTVTSSGLDYRTNFNADPACFVRYAEMQATFAREDGASDWAQRIADAAREVQS